MTVKNAAAPVDETFEARRGDLHELLVADMLERVFLHLENLTIVLAHEAPEHSDKAYSLGKRLVGKFVPVCVSGRKE
jgi:hypothetical protein